MKNILNETSYNGKKAENLSELKKIERKDIYIVPYFVSLGLEDYDIELIEKHFISKNITQVSVRSSSHTEDTQNQSNAGAFKTLLNVDILDIGEAIDEIQKHSLSKFGHKIPVIVQEMVKDIKYAWSSIFNGSRYREAIQCFELS